MKNKFLVLLSIVALLSSCKKKLDLNSSEHFGVKEFLSSKNCEADCGNVAACEGQTVKLIGVVVEDSKNTNNHSFQIVDENDSEYTIDVIVNTQIEAAVFALVTSLEGKKVKIEGIADGFDMPTNLNCERGISLKLTQVGKITE